jgi:hypothetical protein
MKTNLSLKTLFINEENSKEDNVVDMFAFKKKKQAKEKLRGFLLSRDGTMLFHPDEFYFVVIDSDDQGDALGDGDVHAAASRGAVFHEVDRGKILEVKPKESEPEPA